MQIDNDMPDEFYEWLNECPVQWFLITHDSSSNDYTFIAPSKEDTDNG
tara:strand:+ start:64 stop:207 length:144 start_codon:yes stop_codon:yes gene_type:complete